jgi:hypothetical protein
MAKPKAKPAPKTSTPKSKATSTKASKIRTKASKAKAAPKAAGPTHPDNDRKPDAPAGVLVTHARKLANQVRTDATTLVLAKITPADADQLDELADALEAAQTSWDAVRDAQGRGAVVKLRGPLLAGREHLFAALRTFADHSEATQRALDQIAGVEGDEDLVTDTRRLLVLARKHQKDLDGTDVTPQRVAQVKEALAAFQAARSGARHQEDGDKTTSQHESDAMRQARQARNRAFWGLASLVRLVSRRGQYAFRNDKSRRARYNLYRSSTAPRSAAGGEPVVEDP